MIAPFEFVEIETILFFFLFLIPISNQTTTLWMPIQFQAIINIHSIHAYKKGHASKLPYKKSTTTTATKIMKKHIHRCCVLIPLKKRIKQFRTKSFSRKATIETPNILKQFSGNISPLFAGHFFFRAISFSKAIYVPIQSKIQNDFIKKLLFKSNSNYSIRIRIRIPISLHFISFYSMSIN